MPDDPLDIDGQQPNEQGLTELALDVFGGVARSFTHRQLRDFLRRGRRRLEVQEQPKHDELFDAFYEAYPRHEGRTPAYRAWKSLRPGPALVAEIMTAVKQQYGRGVVSEDLACVPFPATWLRDQRWTDEV